MFDALHLKEGEIHINPDECKGCGLCVNSCKFNAITIDYTDKTIDNVVNRIENLIEE